MGIKVMQLTAFSKAHATAVIVLINTAFCLADSGEDSRTWSVPSREVERKNPVLADSRSLRRGQVLYRNNCAACHGSSGKGDGNKAREMNLHPSDLSSAHVAAQSDGAIYWKITTGLSPMPAFKKEIPDEDRWHLVNYLRTLGPASHSSESGSTTANPPTSRPAANNASAGGGESTKSNSPDQNSIARGKSIFDSKCVSCHGPSGKGDGPKASNLKSKPPDLSSAQIARKSDEEILTQINAGRDPMPSFEKELSDDDRRRLVTYIRTFSPARSEPQATGAAKDQAAAPSSGTPSAGVPNSQPSIAPGPPPGGRWNHFVRWVGHFHPPLTAFPIALLLAAAIAECLRPLSHAGWLAGASRWCVILAAAGAAASVPLGWAFAAGHGKSWILEVHRWLGTATGCAVTGILLLSELAHRKGGCWPAVFRVTLFIAVPLVITTGFFGGALVYGLHAYSWTPR